MARWWSIACLFLVLAGCQGPMSGSSVFAPKKSGLVPAPSTGRFKSSNSYYQRENGNVDLQRRGVQEAKAPAARTAQADRPRRGILNWLPARKKGTGGFLRRSLQGRRSDSLNLQGMPVNDATGLQIEIPDADESRVPRRVQQGSRVETRPRGRVVTQPRAESPASRRSSTGQGRRGVVEVIDLSDWDYQIRRTNAETPIRRDQTPTTRSPKRRVISPGSGGWQRRQ